MNAPHWPSRADWERDRRTVYFDLIDDLPLSYALSDYATAEEIVALQAALRSRQRRFHIGSTERDGVNAAIRCAKKNEAYWRLADYVGAADLVRPYFERFEAAKQSAIAARVHEIESTPIDDDAWKEELRRRADIERRYYGGAQ